MSEFDDKFDVVLMDEKVVDNRLIILIIKIKGINCHYLWLLPKMKLTRRVLRIVKIFYYTCRSRTGNGDYLIHTIP